MACTDRERAAFIIAPLVVPIFAAIWLPLAGGLPAMFAGIISYGGVCVLGVPTYLFLRRQGWTALWLAIPIGFVFGGSLWFVALALFALSLGEGIAGARLAFTEAQWLNGILWPSGVIGALVATIFWLIARPDHRNS